MELVLRHHGLDRRDLKDLMTLRLGIVTGQQLLALSTARGAQCDDVVDLIDRE
jgi:hypothetical protein